MLRLLIAILALFACALSPAAAQSCSDMVQTCPDGPGTPTGPWPFCGGCKRPATCPVRNHIYTCHGYIDSFGGEVGLVCVCDYASSGHPRQPPKDFCKRMLTADGSPCTQDQNGTCVCN